MTAVAPRRPVRRPPADALTLVVVLAVATIALLAAGADAGPVGLALLLVGPGAVIRGWLPRGAGADAAISLTVAISVATLMLAASATLWLGVWDPRAWTVAVAAVVGVVAALQLRHRSAPGRVVWPRVSRATAVLLGVQALAAGAWAAALPAIDPGRAEVGGLLVGAAPLLPAALALAVGGFLAAVRLRSWPVAVLALVVAALVLRGTTAVVSAQPMFDWAFKHVGVVDYILEHGRLVRSADIYHNWPGLFAASAWVADATGVGPVAQARWITLGLTALLCLAASALARRLVSPSRWVGLVAALLFLLWNWVGQDYFAPQGVGLVLALVVLGLVLAPDARSAAIAVLVFAGLVISHQLTPFWIVAAVWALLLRRRVRWWIPVVFTVLAGGYFAAHFDVVESYGLFSGTNVVANAQTSGGEFASTAKRIDSWAARGAMAAIWLSAAAVLAWRAWRRRPWYAGAVLAFLPFVLLGAQSYGGESILRVALFSLAGCCAVLAQPLHRLLVAPGAGRALAGSLLVLATGAGTAQAYFGPWYVSQVGAAEVRVARTLLAEVPAHAYLAPALPAWPDRPSGDYVTRLDRAVSDYDASVFDRLLVGSAFRSAQDAEQFERFLGARMPWPTFVIFSRRMEALNDYRGFYAPDALERMRATLPARPGWSVALRDGDVLVLRYVPDWALDEAAANWP